MTRTGQDSKRQKKRQSDVQRTEASRILQKSVQRLTDADHPDTFLEYVLTEIACVVGAANVFLFRYDAADHTLTLHLSYLHGRLRWGVSSDEFRILGAPIPADINAAFALVCRERRFVTPENCPIPVEEFAWPGVMEELPGRHLSDTAHLALLVGDKPVGTLALEFQNGRKLQEEDQSLVQALAQQAAIALRLAAVSEKERRAAVLREQEKAALERAGELERANQALQLSVSQLANVQDTRLFLDTVLLSIIEQTQATGGALFVLNAAADAAQMQSCVLHHSLADIHSDPRLEIWRYPYPLTSFQEGWQAMLTARDGFFVAQVRLDTPGLAPGAAAWHLAMGHHSVVHFPLLRGKDPVGFIGLVFASAFSLTPDKIELVHALTQQATLALELTRLAEEVRQVAVLDERNRLSGEIHDTLAQSFLGLTLQLKAVRRHLMQLPGTQPLEKALTHLEDAETLAREGLAQARRSVWMLRPEVLEQRDLPAAFQHLVQKLLPDAAAKIRVCVEGAPVPLPADIETHLLRIGQEALTNALKHARAAQIVISLTFTPHNVVLDIQDDGRGFAPSQEMGGSYGLRNMRERALHIGARFALNSSPGTGAGITVTLPLPVGNRERSPA